MLEESNSTPQLARICLTILKGKEIFHKHCEQFASLIVGTLNRLGLSTGGPFENKFLAAEVIRLLLEWDEGFSGETRKLLSTEEQDLILNFLVRQLLLLAEPDVRSMKVDHGVRELGETLKTLLEKILLRSYGKIRAQHFEKVSFAENHAKLDRAILSTSLDVLVVVGRSKNIAFLEQNPSLVTQILLASFETARQSKLFRAKLFEFARHAFAQAS
jgi:hypothetical protein